MYEHVAHRTSYANIAETIRDCFRFSVSPGDVRAFKLLLSRYYDETYKELLRRIVTGEIPPRGRNGGPRQPDGQRVCMGLHELGRGVFGVQTIARGKVYK